MDIHARCQLPDAQTEQLHAERAEEVQNLKQPAYEKVGRLHLVRELDISGAS